MKNPFTLSFGRVPIEYITRDPEEERIYHMFTESPITDQIYVLLGVRGSGKTVAMANISKTIGLEKDWIVIKISPIDDIVSAVYSILVHHPRIHELYIDTEVSVSALGLGISLKRNLPPKNTIQEIDNILNALSKRGVKVLITIDEVTDTPQMRAFVSAFQLFITNDRPVFFLATALFERFEELKNVQNLTFLYRAPKIILAPLDIGAMAEAYGRVFSLKKVEALKMASVTKGYPLAFQILGYLWWENKGKEFNEILDMFDLKIADAAYEKLWLELSETDRLVMKAITDAKSHSVKEIRKILEMDPNKFNQYRRRLSSRGLVDIRRYGYITLSLPRFEQFIEMSEYLL